ncbi:MAG: 50S ribosomal protein L25 [Patescibacteria group bacterium]|jgi:large subunit ribosomal protein L25|nr:50S ribosomal protein L25 [Patescibacteria group bacterium]
MTKTNLTLKASTRKEIGKQAQELRQQGKIPAVLYGHKIENKNLTLEYSAFEKIYGQAGDSTLINLAIDNAEPTKVLVQDYQLDPKTGQFIHIDFHQVRMDEKINTDIVLKFSGEAPAVKGLNGVLVTNIDAVEVECLPNDLVSEIEVDLSGLVDFEAAIHVADIKVPKGITIINGPEDVVAKVQAPRKEESADAAVGGLEGGVETPGSETSSGESAQQS